MKLRLAIDQFIEWKSVSSRGSTVTGYAQDLKIFCLLLKNRDIETVTLDDILGVMTEMLDAGWTHTSMMRKCMALRKLFEFMELRGINVIHKDLIPIPRPEHKVPRIITEQEFRKLLAVIPKGSKDARHIRNKAIIRMLWDTGMRIGEVLALDVQDIDTNHMRTLIRTEKNQGSRPFRQIFWTTETNRCLRLWLKRRHTFAAIDPALFISCTSWKVGQRLHHKGLAEMLRKYSKKAGLPYRNAHSFRHHLGHDIIRKGGSNADVANILGHASLLSTFTYTQMSDPEVEERYRKFRG